MTSSTSYTNIFGGSTVQPADVSYVAITLSSNTTLSWPSAFQDTNLVMAHILEVDPTTTSLTLTIPDATQVSVGQDFLIRNTGATSFQILKNNGSNLATIASGSNQYFYLTDNTTVAGTWTQISFGGTGGGSVTNVATGTGLSGGPITSTGTIVLANTAVTPGSYTNASITVDQQGRLTAAATGNTGVTSVIGTSNQISVAGTTSVVVSLHADPIIPGTGGMVPPSGTSAQRPVSPAPGTQRYNSDITSIESYVGGSWIPSVGAGTVTSVAVTGSTGLTVAGSPITGSGTVSLTLDSDLQALSGLAANGIVARVGSASYTLRTLTAGSSNVTISNGDGVSGNPIIDVPANSLAINYAYYQTGALATTTTLFTSDDNVPNNTEGAEFMSLSYTPASASNLLVIKITVLMSNTVLSNATAALFQDSTVNALAATGAVIPGTGYMMILTFTHTMVAGTTSATTFTVRAGADTGGTVSFNGSGGARRYGGVASSSITITEHKAT